ncbi:hypothetical protein VTJ04DRAFT_224 [Mycothermus thermophilus]|uniref:uncharacterized protein n=1 Tax=Humicola insolens TaxID=85995 RepID=UPI003742C0B5
MADTTTANGAKVAVDFQKIIHEARDRKKKEELAAKIFGRSTTSAAKPSPAGSLSSRAGVKKASSTSAARPRHSTGSIGNLNGEWTHDLHDSVNPRQANGNNNNKGASGSGAGSLAARITRPGEKPRSIPTGPAAGVAPKQQRQQRRAAQVARALIKSELQQGSRISTQQPPTGPAIPTGPRAMTKNAAVAPTVPEKGFTIRGLAGPFVVLAQNFAPGTTAADIESAMTPVGGLISSCRIVKTNPIVIAEIVFESKEGADKVIETFNDRVADGRILKVFHKPGNTPSAAPPASAPTGPRAAASTEMVVDGSYGFPDPMETEPTTRAPPTGPAAGNGRLYSDGMVNRRGRGFGGRYR